jgi:hypothetical protein
MNIRKFINRKQFKAKRLKYFFSSEYKIFYLEHHQQQNRVNEQGCSGPIKDLNRAVEPEQML